MIDTITTITGRSVARLDTAGAAYIAEIQKAVADLYDLGVINFLQGWKGTAREVQLSEDAFKANFAAGPPVNEDHRKHNKFIELSVTLDGVRYCCLADKEKSPGKRD